MTPTDIVAEARALLAEPATRLTKHRVRVHRDLLAALADEVEDLLAALADEVERLHVIEAAALDADRALRSGGPFGASNAMQALTRALRGEP